MLIIVFLAIAVFNIVLFKPQKAQAIGDEWATIGHFILRGVIWLWEKGEQIWEKAKKVHETLLEAKEKASQWLEKHHMEFLKATIVRVKDKALNAIVNKTVLFIENAGRGGEKQRPLYIEDWDNFLEEAKDIAIEELVGETRSAQLCNIAGFETEADLRAWAEGIIKPQPLFREDLPICSTEEKIENIQGFVESFEGGWDTWLKITTQPKHNIYGAYLLLQSAKTAEETKAAETEKTKAIAGGGWLSQEQCVKWVKPRTPKISWKDLFTNPGKVVDAIKQNMANLSLAGLPEIYVREPNTGDVYAEKIDQSSPQLRLKWSYVPLKEAWKQSEETMREEWLNQEWDEILNDVKNINRAKGVVEQGIADPEETAPADLSIYIEIAVKEEYENKKQNVSDAWSNFWKGLREKAEMRVVDLGESSDHARTVYWAVLAQNKCTDLNCATPESLLGELGYKCAKYRTLTPAQTIGQMATGALTSGLKGNLIANSEQMNEYTTAITQATINRLSDEATGAATGLFRKLTQEPSERDLRGLDEQLEELERSPYGIGNRTLEELRKRGYNMGEAGDKATSTLRQAILLLKKTLLYLKRVGSSAQKRQLAEVMDELGVEPGQEAAQCRALGESPEEGECKFRDDETWSWCQIKMCRASEGVFKYPDKKGEELAKLIGLKDGGTPNQEIIKYCDNTDPYDGDPYDGDPFSAEVKAERDWVMAAIEKPVTVPLACNSLNACVRKKITMAEQECSELEDDPVKKAARVVARRVCLNSLCEKEIETRYKDVSTDTELKEKVCDARNRCSERYPESPEQQAECKKSCVEKLKTKTREQILQEELSDCTSLVPQRYLSDEAINSCDLTPEQCVINVHSDSLKEQYEKECLAEGFEPNCREITEEQTNKLLEDYTDQLEILETLNRLARNQGLTEEQEKRRGEVVSMCNTLSIESTQCNSCSDADLNSDGIVDVLDLAKCGLSDSAYQQSCLACVERYLGHGEEGEKCKPDFSMCVERFSSIIQFETDTVSIEADLDEIMNRTDYDRLKNREQRISGRKEEVCYNDWHFLCEELDLPGCFRGPKNQ